MKIKKSFGIFILAVILTLVFSACFNDRQGNEGTLIINFGGGGNGRQAGDVIWPPSSWGKIDYPAKFIVTLDGPTGKIEESFAFEASNPNTKISFTLASGRWNVHIEIRIHDTFLYAAGSNSVDIKPGQASSVSIEMNRKYYKIGETGPGGGLIFYVAPEGFDLLDIVSANNKRCHYLEAAPSDVFFVNSTNSGNDYYPPFGTDNDFYVPGTTDGVGEGRKNTQIIVAALKDVQANNMAAQLCADEKYGGFNDWFLPSSGELKLMYDNLYIHSLGGFTEKLVYWSSSFNAYNSFMIQVKGQIFSDDNDSQTFSLSFPEAIDQRARAIRAF